MATPVAAAAPAPVPPRPLEIPRSSLPSIKSVFTVVTSNAATIPESPKLEDVELVLLNCGRYADAINKLSLLIVQNEEQFLKYQEYLKTPCHGASCDALKECLRSVLEPKLQSKHLSLLHAKMKRTNTFAKWQSAEGDKWKKIATFAALQMQGDVKNANSASVQKGYIVPKDLINPDLELSSTLLLLFDQNFPALLTIVSKDFNPDVECELRELVLKAITVDAFTDLDFYARLHFQLQELQQRLVQ